MKEGHSHHCQNCMLQAVLTVAGHSEGNDVTQVVLHKDPHQRNIQDHTLHQHPHEADQECIVQQHCYYRARRLGEGRGGEGRGGDRG